MTIVVLRGMSRRLREAQDANRDRGKTTKDKILSLIAGSEPHGMSTQNLREATGLHRDRIHVICKEYMDKGTLVKTGRFGKYHLGPKSREDIHLRAFFFQQQLFKKFYELSDPGVSLSCKFSRLSNVGSHISLPSREQLERYKEVSNLNQDIDELYLFEYALKLGAILTYQLIQSIRYAQEKTDLDKVKKTGLIVKWIEHIIEPGSLLQSFSQLMSVSKRMQTPREASLFELHGAKFEELENIFRNVFPRLYEDLEKLRHSDEVTGKLNAYKHRLFEDSKARKT